MSEQQNDDIIANWSLVTTSQPNSLQLEVDYNINCSQTIGVVERLNHMEDDWYSVNSSIATPDEQTTSCPKCEQFLAVSVKLELEMVEIKKQNFSVHLWLNSVSNQNFVANTCFHILQLEHLCVTAREVKEERLVLSLDKDAAFEWIVETEVKIIDVQIREDKSTIKLILQKLIGLMIKFETIEMFQEKGCYLLYLLLCSINNIARTTGAIKHLMKSLANKMENYYSMKVLISIAEYKESQQLLVKDEYLSLFLKHMSDGGVEFAYLNFPVSVVLGHLLDCPEDCFCGELSKDTIEEKVVAYFERVGQILIPLFIPYHNDYSWYLDRMITGTRAQRYICAFFFAIASKNPTAKELLIADGCIPLLERVVADAQSEAQIKLFANTALQKLLKFSRTGETWQICRMQ